jgi:tRNA(fMet)-specific endonuclease VapC
MYSLDTNACIEYLNGRSPPILERLRARSPAEIAVCSVVRAELHYGVGRSKNPQEALVRLEEFLAPYQSLPFDDACAKVLAKFGRGLPRPASRLDRTIC